MEDFNWEEHAYSILHKFSPESADAINTQSEYALQMTKGSYGSMNVNTEPFRTAICMYLMSIHGIKDDSYPSNKVNKAL